MLIEAEVINWGYHAGIVADFNINLTTICLLNDQREHGLSSASILAQARLREYISHMDSISAINSSRISFPKKSAYLRDSRAILPTNFYPRYDSRNDQVDPVLPVRKAEFQEILPRYRTSTSETRDQGTGNLFEGQRINILV